MSLLSRGIFSCCHLIMKAPVLPSIIQSTFPFPLSTREHAHPKQVGITNSVTYKGQAGRHGQSPDPKRGMDVGWVTRKHEPVRLC